MVALYGTSSLVGAIIVERRGTIFLPIDLYRALREIVVLLLVPGVDTICGLLGVRILICGKFAGLVYGRVAGDVAVYVVDGGELRFLVGGGNAKMEYGVENENARYQKETKPNHYNVMNERRWETLYYFFIDMDVVEMNFILV